LLLLIFFSGFVQAEQTYSESFPLVESASVTRSVFAAEGDRIVGNFSVSDMPTWTDSSTGNKVTVQYAFKVSKIEGLEKCPTDIVLYEVYQTNSGSFDVLCEFSGDYRFRFNVGVGPPDLGIGSMKATLNYVVVENSSIQNPIKTSTPSLDPTSVDNSLARTGIAPSLLAGVGVLIVILVVCVVYAAARVKRVSR
jgi:hypothetical protein